MSNTVSWILVGVSAGLGIIACCIFSQSLAGPIALSIVKIFM